MQAGHLALDTVQVVAQRIKENVLPGKVDGQDGTDVLVGSQILPLPVFGQGSARMQDSADLQAVFEARTFLILAIVWLINGTIELGGSYLTGPSAGNGYERTGVRGIDLTFKWVGETPRDNAAEISAAPTLPYK